MERIVVELKGNLTFCGVDKGEIYDFSNMIISTSYLSQEQLRELLFSAVTKIS